MKVHLDMDDENETPQPSYALNYTIQGQKDRAGDGDGKKHLVLEDHFCRSMLFDQAGGNYLENECLQISGKLHNGSVVESQSVISRCDLDMLEVSQGSCTIHENDENDSHVGLTPEIQQAYRIFQSFLLEKYKAVTAPFWFPIGNRASNDMCLKKIDNKFAGQEYESITEFVADFRQMLENCYRYHGVDHWISKQAQKLEIILEQKLTLLSRTLREKTALSVTSRGRFGTEDEKALVGTSTRRRSVPRNLAVMSVCGSETIMVQALRLEEQQRAKEEKKQRDLEKKEAGEASAKEVEEWECSLLSLAEPWPISTMWELPAIGHFLCLAQTALNLPEIVFFELERCLLMPRCSSFLAKIMTSLLCPPHRRLTLHRRPALPYCRWEAELRQKVLGWYQSVGRAKDQEACAEHLGLCHRFFWTLGEISPLEEKPFHLLPFNQRVWLLKGLCDNVYETQKDVQDAVLGQPIHECRESILGYDSKENTYIHFPHFCGADLRIYCQSPCLPLEYPLPPFSVKKLEPEMVDMIEDNSNSCPEVKAGNWELCLRVRDDGSDESEIDWKGPDKFNFPCKEELPNADSIKDKPVEIKQSREFKEVKQDTDYEPCLLVSKFPDVSLRANAFEASLPLEMGATVKNGPSCQSRRRLCFSSESDRLSSGILQQTSHSRAEGGKILSKKKRQKKENLLGVKTGTGKLGLKKLKQARVGKSTMCKATARLKRKDKRKKLGRKLVHKKPQEKNQDHPVKLPVEPTFKLVCTSLDELRDLISKTEDELDELESTKKRCERWYIKREAVKELHITFIRLLNELLPWEPKLLKAFHRNRVRLKKESDNFKKHPEYENFFREERTAFEVDGDKNKAEINRDVKDEDKTERLLKGDHGTTDYENHIGNHSLAHVFCRPEVTTALNPSGPFTRSSKRCQSGGVIEDFSPCKKGKMIADDSVISEPKTEVTSRDQHPPGANSSTIETKSGVAAPQSVFQRRCNPIQALLAKSVGNKVTLISHPQVSLVDQPLQCSNKTVSAALTTATLTAVCQPTPQPTSATTQAHTSTPSSVQRPMQSVYKAPEGSSLVRNNNTPVRFSMQPVIHQKTDEKPMQQVIILPTNLLIQNTQDKRAQQSSITPAATTKPVTLLSNTSGFTVPENKIPVQPISPLKNINTVITSSTVSPSLQKSASCRVSPAHKKTAESSSIPKGFTTATSATTDSKKCELNQELKTVCIRDSQSILVTTRGGNTGVVKVQTSDNSGACVLPPSPVFTLPPKFQALLVSKASTITASTAQIPTTSKLLPVFTSANGKGISRNSTAQSPFNHTSLVDPSDLIEILSSTAPFNDDLHFPVGSVAENSAKSAQMSSDINSQVAKVKNIQTNASVPSCVWSVQTTASENVFRVAQKKPQDTSASPDHSTFLNVFVVTSTTTGSVSSTTTTFASSVFPGSRVKFLSQSGSTCSTVTVAKGLPISAAKITAKTTPSAAEVIKVRPTFGQAIGNTSAGMPTEVQGMNITGLAVKIPDRTTMTSKKTAETVTKVAPVMSKIQSRHLFVQGNISGSNSCFSLNINSPVKVTGPIESKNVQFSIYDTGHMASSELISVAQKKTAVSVPDILNNKSELVTTSSAPNMSCSVSGNPFPQGTALLKGVMQDKSLDNTFLSTAFTTFKLPIISDISRVCQPVSTTTAKPISDNPSAETRSAMASLVTPTIPPPIPAVPTTVPEKVMINTTTPLAPGTQLIINNTRFVVPAQGIAPGSHVLISSSPAYPTSQFGINPVCPAPRVAATLSSPPPPTASFVQGLRMVTPGSREQDTSVRQPTPITAKTEQSVSAN